MGSGAWWRGAPGASIDNIPAPGAAAGSGWTPTVVNLLVLIGVEIVAYCLLRWAFRSAHGG